MMNDVDADILIRQEADSHVGFEPICARAATSRTKSSGLEVSDDGSDRDGHSTLRFTLE